ncbi:MAG: CARDB domain-containing protein [Gemmatales bacterium]
MIVRQTRELISIANDGVSYFPRAIESASMTPDGRYVVFISNQNAYVRDRQLATTKQVNVNSLGVPGNRSAYGPAAISDDGRYIAFVSSATNLDTAFASGSIQSDNIYLRDLVAGTTRLISRNTTGTGSGDNFSSQVNLSGDGRYLTFHSLATNLTNGDSNVGSDVFRYDRLTDALSLVSVRLAGNGTGDRSSTLEDVSSDGRFVAFNSASTNLVSQTTNGSNQLFVRDMTNGTTQLVTLAANGTSSSNLGGNTLSLSSDGRYAVFYSFSNNLVTGLTTSGETVYWRDLQTGQTRMVSVNVNGTGGSSTGVPASGVYIKPVVSDDGRYVAFAHNGTDLVSGIQSSGSNPYNVYVRDVAAGKTRLLSTDVTGNGGAAGGQSVTQPFNISITADGSLVFFDHGSSNLVPGDVNRANDVFLATTATASGSIRGKIFDDKNRNTTQDPGELGLADITVYIDANNNGSLDNNEVFAISQADGSYALLGLEAGLNHLRMNLSVNNSQTFPTGNQSQDVTLATSTSAVTGIDFGVAQKLPDLVPFSISSVATTSPGRTITVNWYEFNYGEAAAPSGWTDALYLSKDNILDPSDILLGTFRHATGLAAGTFSTFSMDVTMPPASGAYRIIVQADRKNLVTESNRDNNTGASTSLINVNLPHLVLGTPLNDQFTAVNQTLYYQLDIADGDKAVRLAATRGSGGQVGLAIQNLNGQPVTGTLCASLASGSYIVAVTDFGPQGSPLSFSLLASQPGPSIDVVQPGSVGNAGSATFQIAGTDLSARHQLRTRCPQRERIGYHTHHIH